MAAFYEKRFFVLPCNLHSKRFKSFYGKVDIGAAFYRRDKLYNAVFFHKRKNKKKSGDKLAADIAFYFVCSALQFSAKGYFIRFRFKENTLFFKDIFIDGKGTGKQFFASDKSKCFAVQKAYRNKKAQGASAFAAFKHGTGWNIADISAGDGNLIAFCAVFCSDGRKAVQSGLHILGRRDAFYNAGSVCKSGADKQPVSHAFGRRSGHCAFAFGRFYFGNQGFSLLSLRISIASR